MPTLSRTVLAAAGLVLAASATQAVEPFAPYDNFGGGQPINPSLWANSERTLTIKRGALEIAQRNWGQTNSDSGSTPFGFNENLTNPAAVTELKAKITVNALEADTCPANSAVTSSRARIIGSFYNVGTPAPPSQVGDAFAQVRLVRFTNSTDPAGTLRVQGLLAICTSADCLASNLVGSIVDLGTVNVGSATTVQLQWDQASKTFNFSRDNGAKSGSVTYTDSDANAPAVPYKQLSTRMDVPSCQSGPRVTGYVDANFDNVAVNKSAAP